MRNYLRSEAGGALAEYALILAILGGGLALAVINFRAAARTAVENAATTLSYASTSSSGSTNSTNSTNSATTTTGNGNGNGNGNAGGNGRGH